MIEYFKESDTAIKFEQLTEGEKFILFCYAFWNEVVTLTWVENAARQKGFRIDNFKDAYVRLWKLGWLTKVSYANSYAFILSKDVYFYVAFSLLENNAVVLDMLNAKARYTKPCDYWTMAQAIVQRDFKTILSLSSTSEEISYRNSYFQPFFKSKEMRFVLTALNSTVLLKSIEDWFRQQLLMGLSPNDFEEAEMLVKDLASCKQASEQSHIAGLVSLYKYVSLGIQDDLGKDVADCNLLTLRALIAMRQGDYPLAQKYFDSTFKIRNRFSAVKNFFANPIFDFFLMLCYCKANNETARKKVVTLLKKMDNCTVFVPTVALGRRFLHGETIAESIAYYIERAVTPVEQALGSICYHFFKVKNKLKKVDFLEKPSSIALLRNEQRLFFPVGDEAPLQTSFGIPQLSGFAMKEDWQIRLEEVVNLSDKIKSDESSDAPRDLRIAYVIETNEQVRVMEQRILKNGKWSVGSVLPIRDFQKCQLPSMDELDKKIARTLSPYNHYSLGSIDEILPHLLGSDRVFYKDAYEMLPATVTEEPVYISVEPGKDYFNIETNVTANGFYPHVSECMVRNISPGHYAVYHIKPENVQLISNLLALQKIPISAQTELASALSKLSKNIEIHSSLLAGGSSLQKIDGNALIIMTIVKHSDVFHLQLGVQPLENGKMRFMPGKGKTTFYDETNGNRYQVTRDLETERKRLSVLNQFLEERLDIFLDDDEFELSMYETLMVLTFANEHSDEFVVEWDKKANLRIASQLTSSSLALKLKSNNNWFDVEGEVSLSENQVLTAEMFLKLLAGGVIGNRFIRLNETDFIEISEQLCKSMKRLESLAQKNKGKASVPFYHVGALAEIVNDSSGAVAADTGLEKLVKKIEAAGKMRIEVPKTMNAELREYQVEGFEWMSRLAEWGAGACLADDMGLGKTVQTIAFFLRKAAEGPILVVSPVSVVMNWVRELQRFAPTLRPIVLNEADDRVQMLAKLQPFDVALTSYGLLVREEENLTKMQWNVICLDEAHTIKNRDTKMSGVAMQLQSKHRVILTGTPIQNNLAELWNLFQFLNPGLLGTFEHFTNRFIKPIEYSEDKEVQRQLKRIVMPFLLRRTKSQVLDELPEKDEIIRLVEMSAEEKAAYEIIRDNAEKMLKESKSMDVKTLAEITKLRQAACSMALVQKEWPMTASKITEFINLAENIIAGNNSVLVFSQFTSFLTLVKKEVDAKIGADSYFYLDGGTPLKKREEMVSRFHNGEKKMFIISLKAGGLGLNLTRANYVIHLDPWWNPAIEQQATDRAYRIGQLQNVTIYHLISQNTIEEKILRLHKKKQDLVDALLSDMDMSHALTLDDLKMLING